MIIEHLILAAASSVDRDRNTLSVFDFLEDVQLELPQGQTARIPLQVIAVVRRDASDIGEIRSNFVLSAFGPGKAQLGRNDIPVNLAAQHARQRVRVDTALEITGAGEYLFRFEKGDLPSLNREISIRATVMPRIGRG
jgi:hypothetical protein